VNGDVGPSHFVQVANFSFVVFDKSGKPLYGAWHLSSLFADFGGYCETSTSSDPVVKYDSLADRWLISVPTHGTLQHLQCVAISATGDPTGAYHRYAFAYADDRDFSKIALWPDAYVATYNTFTENVCALDRASMLEGAAATQHCFFIERPTSTPIAADLDGKTLPPAGSPAFIAMTDPGGLSVRRLHVDWTTPGNSSLGAALFVPAAPFTPVSHAVPQPGTNVELDPMPGSPNNRFAYRNFGDHEALVLNSTVDGGQAIGIRWYELRVVNGIIGIHQQGTFAPDGDSRFTASAAMDKAGGIALAYSVSSPTTFPAVRFTGRRAGDAPGLMTLGEGSLIEGAGSQTFTFRWGDYGNLAVDPIDGCTFWYSGTYLDSSSHQHTRIGSFRLPGCLSTVSNDFSIKADPASQGVLPGATARVSISTQSLSGQPESLQLSVSAPSGVTGALDKSALTAGEPATLTLSVDQSRAAGPAAIVIRAVAPSATHEAAVTLEVGRAPADFGLTLDRSSIELQAGGRAVIQVSTRALGGPAEEVALSIVGLPAGVSAELRPPRVVAGGSAELVLQAAPEAQAGTSLCTVTGTAPSASHGSALTIITSAVASSGPTPPAAGRHGCSSVPVDLVSLFAFGLACQSRRRRLTSPRSPRSSSHQ
jgi:hypothetical protein